MRVRERVLGHDNGGASGAAVHARASQGYGTKPNQGGDRVQMLTPAENVPCTLFKASQKCISVIQFFYTKEGMLNN